MPNIGYLIWVCHHGETVSRLGGRFPVDVCCLRPPPFAIIDRLKDTILASHETLATSGPVLIALHNLSPNVRNKGKLGLGAMYLHLSRLALHTSLSGLLMILTLPNNPARVIDTWAFQ